MSIRKKITGIIGNIMMSCEKATFLMSVEQHEKLSLPSRLHLKIHLLTCNACKNFSKQINLLSNHLKNVNQKLKNGQTPFKFPADDRNRLENDLRNKMKE